jgi:DNA-directed RNA polymerase specialized sigma24 family protein
MLEKPAIKLDALLEPLLLTASDEQADEFVLRLIAVHLEVVVKGIIRYKLHLRSQDATERAEADDLYQEVLLQLLTELRQLRKQPEAYPIADVRGLAAIIAHRTCSGWMRRRFPERHAFKSRLYYLLTRQVGLAIWRDESGTRVAGFALWQQERKGTTPERLKQLSEDEGMFAHVRAIQSGRPHELSGALAAIFNFIGSPVEFDELVNTLAALLQIREHPMESTDQIEETIGLAAAGGVDTAWHLEKRTFLQRLWEEIQQLPPNQRAALLLNLKDASGGGGIALFPATGIATMRQLAESLEMSAEEFAGLWNELPLEDARIAQILRLTRQQVINARKSARERLTRRLKGFM